MQYFLRTIILLSSITLGLAGCVTTQSTPDVQTSASKINSGNTDTFPLKRPATGNKVFIFSPQEGEWAAYDAKGDRVNTGRASGGRDFCEDINRPCRTIVGQFKVLTKGGPDCVSHIFPIETSGGAPMPYCMLFSSQGYAIHGSNDVPDYNASHGCVRVTPAAAEWLSKNFIQLGTTVIVEPY